MKNEHAKKLEKFKSESDNYLQRYVAGHLIELEKDDDALESWLADLLQHGCASGMVGELCYYKSTHAFYDYFYNEIEEMRERHEDDLGEPIKIKGDLKNFFAWLAFEETTRELAQQVLELEI
jgi:hypothetical protein